LRPASERALGGCSDQRAKASMMATRAWENLELSWLAPCSDIVPGPFLDLQLLGDEVASRRCGRYPQLLIHNKHRISALLGLAFSRAVVETKYLSP
jgi:hypothetical protein